MEPPLANGALGNQANSVSSKKRKRRETLSRHDSRRNEARLTFNKVIQSHYRKTGNEYSRVGALFLTWKDSDLDLHGEDNEVSDDTSMQATWDCPPASKALDPNELLRGLCYCP